MKVRVRRRLDDFVLIGVFGVIAEHDDPMDRVLVVEQDMTTETCTVGVVNVVN